MAKTTRQQRQHMACGYELQVAGSRAWQPPLSKLGFKHTLPVWCPGYTTRLPEVREVVRAHAHWAKGQLQTFCGSEQPTDVLLAYLEILDTEVEAMKAWATTSVANGGGRP
jgi:hypothetical protein